jgi:hypothetical protein
MEIRVDALGRLPADVGKAYLRHHPGAIYKMLHDARRKLTAQLALQ